MSAKGMGQGRSAKQKRKAATSPVEALRVFAHWAADNERSYVRFFVEGSDNFMATTWAVALVEAHRLLQQDHDSEKANSALLNLIDGERKGSVLPWKEHPTTKTADRSKSSRTAAS